MIDLSGKSAIVTGGSRGIGRAIATRLAEQGADVCVSYKGNEAAANEVVAAIEGKGRRAIAVQADASDQEAANGLIKTALEEFGKIDVLVNNAGLNRDDLIMRMKPEDWSIVLDGFHSRNRHLIVEAEDAAGGKAVTAAHWTCVQ